MFKSKEFYTILGLGILAGLLISSVFSDRTIQNKLQVLENRISALERIELEHKTAINLLERKLWIEVMSQ